MRFGRRLLRLTFNNLNTKEPSRLDHQSWGPGLSPYRRYCGQHYHILRCRTPRTPCQRLRLRDHHLHRVLLQRLAPLFTMFFDDWGRDEDPRWFGGEHSPGVGGPHKNHCTRLRRITVCLLLRPRLLFSPQTTTEDLPTSCSVQCERTNLQLELYQRDVSLRTQTLTLRSRGACAAVREELKLQPVFYLRDVPMECVTLETSC